MSFSGASGEFFIAAELSRMGYIALPTTRNTKGFDLIASNKDFTKTSFIQIKTNKSKYDFWIVGKPIIPAPDRFYAFVNLLDERSRPEYYIVSSKVVNDDYTRASNAIRYDALDSDQINAIISFIKQGKTAWQIVYQLGVHIRAVRKIARDNSRKIKYDRGKGEDFPYSFTIKKSDEIKYRDRWDILSL